MKPKITRMRVGEGRISGAIAIFLGLLSLAAILCFKFPEQFTTPEFREVYSAELVEKLMFGGIITTFLFGLISLLLNKNKQNATIGIALGVLAVILGGFTVEGRYQMSGISDRISVVGTHHS